jgi:hypothetical protein
LTVARLFSVFDNFINQDTYFKGVTPFLFKNTYDIWKRMSANRYQAITEVGIFWKYAFSYKKNSKINSCST